MNYDALFVNPLGRTSRGEFIPALLTVLAAIMFFNYLVGGRTAQFCMLVLLYPAFVLLARRLQDLGKPAWLVLLPLLPMLAAFAALLGYFTPGAALGAALSWGSLALAGGFALWGCVGPARHA